MIYYKIKKGEAFLKDVDPEKLIEYLKSQGAHLNNTSREKDLYEVSIGNTTIVMAGSHEFVDYDRSTKRVLELLEEQGGPSVIDSMVHLVGLPLGYSWGYEEGNKVPYAVCSLSTVVRIGYLTTG